jgi:hypothetical protein
VNPATNIFCESSNKYPSCIQQQISLMYPATNIPHVPSKKYPSCIQQYIILFVCFRHRFCRLYAFGDSNKRYQVRQISARVFASEQK